MSAPNPNFGTFEQETALHTDVSAYLIRAILTGDLKERDRVVIRALAKQLGASPTLVRKSIMDLEAIGLLKTPPNESAIVRKLGPGELYEIYQLRALLEGEAARLSCGRIPRATLLGSHNEAVRLRQATPSEMTEQWTADVLRHDAQVHQIVSHFCGSGRLFHEIGRYVTLVKVIRGMSGPKRDGMLQMLDEHDSTLEALLIPNRDIAGRRMAQHIYASALADIRVLFGPAAVTKLKTGTSIGPKI